MQFLLVVGVFLSTAGLLSEGVTATTLSPQGVAYVCSGDRFEVTCTLDADLLLWNTSILGPNGYTVQKFGISVTETRQINSTQLVISRVSTLPLTSTLSLNPVTDGLNGTEIECVDLDSPDSMLTTIMNVINASDSRDQPNQLKRVNITEKTKQKEINSVTVLFEWIAGSPLYSYNITVDPPPLDLDQMFNDSTKAQLKLSYNTRYNVSVVATHPCGNFSSVIAASSVYYALCGDISGIVDSSVTTDHDVGPTVQGSVVMFTCSPGLVLTGPNTTTCVENGEWEPDPKSVECAELATSIIIDVTAAIDNIPVIIGSLFAAFTVAIISLIAIIIVAFIIMKVKRKAAGSFGQVDCKQGDQDNNYIYMGEDVETSERNVHNTTCTTTRGLVYAEIGPSSFNQQANQHTSSRSIHAIDFDDAPVEYAQLTHKNISSVEGRPTETETDNKRTGNNVEINLDNLLVQLRPEVAPKWYEFGEAVKIQKSLLNNYAKHCKCPDDCLMEVLDHWLRHSETKPTWMDVSNALKAINLDQLACNIERVYTTGKLPVEVDMDWAPPPKENEKMTEELDAPPVPPKSMACNQLQLGGQGQHQQHPLILEHLPPSVISSAIMDTVDRNVPPLPPKPTKYSGLPAPDVPARPPKRIT